MFHHLCVVSLFLAGLIGCSSTEPPRKAEPSPMAIASASSMTAANASASAEIVVSKTPQGKLFVACGKEWLTGRERNVSYQDTHEWIATLGEGWRHPTLDELRAMLKEVYGRGAPTSEFASWAEATEPNQAVYIRSYGGEHFESKTHQHPWGIALAVRNRK